MTRYHYMSIRIGQMKIQSQELVRMLSSWKSLLLMEAYIGSYFIKQFGRFLKKLNGLCYDSVFLLLGIYSKKGKHVHTKTFTLIFIAALLIITTSWKQPICVSVDEWLHIVYLYNGILLSVEGGKWGCSAGDCHYKVRAWGSFFFLRGRGREIMELFCFLIVVIIQMF